MRWVIAFYEIGIVSVAAVELFEFAVKGSSLDRGPRDFIAIEMQNREHSAIAHRIQKSIRFPVALERTGFRLAVAHYAQYYEIGVIESRAEGVNKRVPQLAAFV